jgi:sterol desaturase/sphingolipid hydroxylase (fatty acid hydroxylase superfamily)
LCYTLRSPPESAPLMATLTVHGIDRIMRIDDDTVYRNTVARMFRLGLVEWGSRVHPIVPALIFVPIVSWFVRLSALAIGGRVALAVLGGLAFWSLAEYLLHRFAFHLKPTGLLSRIAYVYLHGIHHHYPDDPYRLVMVPPISLPLAAMFWLAFSAVLPPGWAEGAFAGMSTGYLIYDYTHWATHHAKLPDWFVLRPLQGWLKAARKRHMKHHFGDNTKGFGVSMPLWDHVFGTVDPEPQGSPSRAP